MSAAAMTQASIKNTLTTVQTASNTLLGQTPTFQFARSYDFKNTAGTNLATKEHVLRYTFTASETKSLDLNGGTLVDPNGDAITFARLYYIAFAVVADGVNVSGVKINGAASNVIADLRASVLPGNHVEQVNFQSAATGGGGWVLTNATADLVVLTNLDATNAASADLILIGA